MKQEDRMWALVGLWHHASVLHMICLCCVCQMRVKDPVKGMVALEDWGCVRLWMLLLIRWEKTGRYSHWSMADISITAYRVWWLISKKMLQHILFLLKDQNKELKEAKKCLCSWIAMICGFITMGNNNCILEKHIDEGSKDSSYLDDGSVLCTCSYQFVSLSDQNTQTPADSHPPSPPTDTTPDQSVQTLPVPGAIWFFGDLDPVNSQFFRRSPPPHPTSPESHPSLFFFSIQRPHLNYCSEASGSNTIDFVGQSVLSFSLSL